MLAASVPFPRSAVLFAAILFAPVRDSPRPPTIVYESFMPMSFEATRMDPMPAPRLPIAGAALDAAVDADHV